MRLAWGKFLLWLLIAGLAGFVIYAIIAPVLQLPGLVGTI